MKVIQINSECGRGSTGKIAVAISELLDSKQIENYIFYSGNHKCSFKNAIQINGRINIRFHQILSWLFGNQGLHSSLSTKRMIRKIKRINPDIIQLHNIHGYYLDFRILFKFLANFSGKVYWTLHDCWSFTGHCTHFAYSKCNKWMVCCDKCPQKKEYPYSLIFDRSKYLFKLKKHYFSSVKKMELISPSNWLASLLKESFLRFKTVHVINNGVDLNVFYPRNTKNILNKYPKLNKKFVILGVSSVWHRKKGLDTFISLSKYLSEDYQIVLVGGDDSLKANLPNNIIHIVRTLNQDELAELYSIADVFLNPTLEDTFPTVNMESISCGTPVITFPSCGSPEIVKNGCGTILKDYSISSLLNVIYKYKETNYKKKCACLLHRNTFDKNISFNKYVDLYLSNLKQ